MTVSRVYVRFTPREAFALAQLVSTLAKTAKQAQERENAASLALRFTEALNQAGYEIHKGELCRVRH